MPLELGLASSHAPTMFASLDKWPRIYEILAGGVPQPLDAQEETQEVLAAYAGRIKRGFGALRSQLAAYKPDALIVVGDDQNEVFGPSFRCSMAMYLGAELSGSLNFGFLGEPLDQNHVHLRCHAELSRLLLARLVEEGFDFGWIEELRPISRPAAGIGHAFSRPSHAMGVDEMGIPIIVLFLNAYDPPLPAARRCWDLGKAIRRVLGDRPERIAIYGSGGLSHDPRGPRSGWIDEPLDRWVLDRIVQGRGEDLTSLFRFDSDTLRSGTGEIRSWITVAGAFEGRPATVVDYIPARHAVTGLGFAYWPLDGVG